MVLIHQVAVMIKSIYATEDDVYCTQSILYEVKKTSEGILLI